MSMEIQVRYNCPECNGTGVVQNPDWAEFYEQPNAKQMSEAETEAWFIERGLMVESKPYLGHTVCLFPEEEIPCGECDGTGMIQRWMPVEEVVAKVGARS